MGKGGEATAEAHVREVHPRVMISDIYDLWSRSPRT